MAQVFQLQPIKRRIERLEQRLQTGAQMTPEEQRELLNELKARPWRFTFEKTQEPVDLLFEYKRKSNGQKIAAKTFQKLILELDSGDILTFEIKKVTRRQE